MHAPQKLCPEPIDPLVRNEITAPSGIRFSVSCFAGTDWSLRNMYDAQDVYRYPDFALKLANAFVAVGATEVYALTPGFNGKILLRSNLSTLIRLPHDVYLHRNRAMPADGCHLSERGDAGVFSAGGCGVVVATYDNDCLFAHAGRETILDQTEVLSLGRERSREFDLAQTLLSGMGGEQPDPKKLHVWPMYFIGPNEFVHSMNTPKLDHALYNEQALVHLPRTYPGEFGWASKDAIGIDLPRILRAQLVARGVPRENVHLEHADLHKELPTTRNGGGNNSRYLVVGVRHSSPK